MMDGLDSSEFSSLLTSLLVERDAVDVVALARCDAVFANPAALEAIGWEAATPLIPSLFHQSSEMREWSRRALAAVSLHASVKECVLTVNESFDAHRSLFFPRPEDGPPIRRAVIDAALAAVCAALATLIRRIAAARLGCGRMIATVANVLCTALADRDRWLANFDEFRLWSNGTADALSTAVEVQCGPQSEAAESATEFDMLHWLGDTALSWASTLHRYPGAVRDYVLRLPLESSLYGASVTTTGSADGAASLWRASPILRTPSSAEMSSAAAATATDKLVADLALERQVVACVLFQLLGKLRPPPLESKWARADVFESASATELTADSGAAKMADPREREFDLFARLYWRGLRFHCGVDVEHVAWYARHCEFAASLGPSSSAARDEAAADRPWYSSLSVSGVSAFVAVALALNGGARSASPHFHWLDTIPYSNALLSVDDPSRLLLGLRLGAIAVRETVALVQGGEHAHEAGAHDALGAAFECHARPSLAGGLNSAQFASLGLWRLLQLVSDFVARCPDLNARRRALFLLEPLAALLRANDARVAVLVSTARQCPFPKVAATCLQLLGSEARRRWQHEQQRAHTPAIESVPTSSASSISISSTSTSVGGNGSASGISRDDAPSDVWSAFETRQLARAIADALRVAPNACVDSAADGDDAELRAALSRLGAAVKKNGDGDDDDGGDGDDDDDISESPSASASDFVSRMEVVSSALQLLVDLAPTRDRRVSPPVPASLSVSDTGSKPTALSAPRAPASVWQSLAQCRVAPLLRRCAAELDELDADAQQLRAFALIPDEAVHAARAQYVQIQTRLAASSHSHSHSHADGGSSTGRSSCHSCNDHAAATGAGGISTSASAEAEAVVVAEPPLIELLAMLVPRDAQPMAVARRQLALIRERAAHALAVWR